jgi:hypothetical protein
MSPGFETRTVNEQSGIALWGWSLVLILLGSVAASLIVMSAEIVADLGAQAGVPAMLDLVIAGAIG